MPGQSVPFAAQTFRSINTAMTSDAQEHQSKEKFRPDYDPAMDQELEAALAGAGLDDLTTAGDTTAESRLRISGDVTGTVTHVDLGKNEILVELDGKNQGVASAEAFEEAPAAGQQVEFTVDRFDMQDLIYILVKKGSATSSVAWESLRVGQIVEGTVTSVNKGGLEVQVGNIRAFMPMGQVDVQFHKDISVFLNQRVKAEVTKVDRGGRNLILSRRNLIEKERAEQKGKLFEELAEGQTRRGTISSVMDYGAFVDLGGADGLIHVSELAYRRGTKAGEVVSVGDIVDVKVTKFDKITGKIGLSLKQLMNDPWAGAEHKFAVGMPVTGRVVKIESFGAFVEIEEGLEGLLPISEISWQRVKSVGETLKENDILRLVVIALSPEARKITLSLKQAGEDPWKSAAERYSTGEVVTGTVARVVDFGAFVELEAGLEGLVHISELSNQRVRATGDVVKPGQSVQVRVLEVDGQKRRIALSMKQAAAPAELSVGSTAGQPTPAAPAVRKKPKKLKGGLER